MSNTGNNKSVKKWIILLALPVISLLLVLLTQLIIKFFITTTPSATPELGIEPINSTSTLIRSINILTIVIGSLSTIGLFLAPIWLVMLVRDLAGRKRSKGIALVLAIIFGIFVWLYTYEVDQKKFWLNLIAMILTLGIWSPFAWIWAVVNTAVRPEKFYLEYNNHSSAFSASPLK